MATPTSGNTRRYLHIAGILLGVGGIVFVVQRLLVYRSQIDLSAMTTKDYAAFVALCLIYGASNVLLAAGWRQILLYLGAVQSVGWTVRTYAVSQLAKYVPGNIFHLVGRQALGASAGIEHGVLAKSSLLELVMIGVCAAVFLPLLLPLVGWGGAAGSVALGCILLSALAMGLQRVERPALAKAAIFYSAYLLVSGITFLGSWGIAGGQVTISNAAILVGAYVVAWLAGLVTPGAPAGLGVREAVLLVLLANLAAAPVILLAVVIGRAVTVLGDLAFYIIGGVWGRRALSGSRSS